MFCGDGEDYQTSFSFTPVEEAQEAPVAISHGEKAKEVINISIGEVEPPSAESMLKRLRKKMKKGSGLKQI